MSRLHVASVFRTNGHVARVQIRRSIAGYSKEETNQLLTAVGISVPLMGVWYYVRVYVVQPLLDQRSESRKNEPENEKSTSSQSLLTMFGLKNTAFDMGDKSKSESSSTREIEPSTRSLPLTTRIGRQIQSPETAVDPKSAKPNSSNS